MKNKNNYNTKIINLEILPETQLVSGMGMLSGRRDVEPPTDSTRADLDSWKKTCMVEKVLPMRGIVYSPALFFACIGIRVPASQAILPLTFC
jgi:hypothetical protein